MTSPWSPILWEGDTWPLRDHQAEEDDQKIITITTTTTTTTTTADPILTTRLRMRVWAGGALWWCSLQLLHLNLSLTLIGVTTTWLWQSDTPQTSETTRIQNCIKILPSTYWQSSVGMEIKISFHNFYSYRIGSNCCLRYYWCLDWIQQLTHVNNLNLNSKFRSLVQTKYKPKSVINWNHFLLPTVKYK